MDKKVNKYCAWIAAFLVLEMLLFSINFSMKRYILEIW